MRKLFAGIAAVGLLAVSGCATPPSADMIEARIVRACAATGLFKAASGAVVAAYPVAALPAALVNARVDRVCADPARYANDAATIATALTALRDIAVR